jgi:hypothetical protein
LLQTQVEPSVCGAPLSCSEVCFFILHWRFELGHVEDYSIEAWDRMNVGIYLQMQKDCKSRNKTPSSHPKVNLPIDETSGRCTARPSTGSGPRSEKYAVF